MMFQSFCVSGLWMLVAVLLCHREIEAGFQYGQELCPPDANVDDACHDGAGACKQLTSENANKNGSVASCVPSDCGVFPVVQNGQYEENDCFNVYTCASLVCDDGFQLDGGDAWMQCWFDGWSNGVGAPVPAKCSQPAE